MSERVTIFVAALFVTFATSSCAWLDEMREPDRTITIVSIIGLIIIWGSVLYHKFVQGGTIMGGDAAAADDFRKSGTPPPGGSPKSGNKKKSKKRN